MSTFDLYLASQSPRRREILQQMGVRHQSLSVAVEEIPEIGELPWDYVQRLAREKAVAGLEYLRQNNLPLKPVLGADTLGVIDDDILEKPVDQTHAEQMLQRLSGTWHQVMTAVAIAAYVEDPKTSELKLKTDVRMSVTDVEFRVLSDAEIQTYWHTGEPQDKAGSYAIQGLGAVFVKQIRGSYTGVVGLSVEQTLSLLDEFSVPWWQTKTN